MDRFDARILYPIVSFWSGAKGSFIWSPGFEVEVPHRCREQTIYQTVSSRHPVQRVCVCVCLHEDEATGSAGYCCRSMRRTQRNPL